MKALRFVSMAAAVLAIAVAVSCSSMNDLHDVYLQNGPIVYIGHLDSLHVYPGNQRVKVDYWVTDARAKEVRFFWNNKKDSVSFPVNVHEPEDMLTATFPIDEGDMVLSVYTYDDKEHRSIKFEQAVTIYGPKYEGTLSGRSVVNTTVNGTSVTIKWSGASNSAETGMEIIYTDVEGKQVTDFKATSTLASGTTLDNVDVTKPVQYRSVFVPVEGAIDQFYSVYNTLAL